jgi:hypothetical protein
VAQSLCGEEATVGAMVRSIVHGQHTIEKNHLGIIISPHPYTLQSLEWFPTNGKAEGEIHSVGGTIAVAAAGAAGCVASRYINIPSKIILGYDFPTNPYTLSILA